MSALPRWSDGPRRVRGRLPLLLLALAAGCAARSDQPSRAPERVFGQPGRRPGQFVKPRAIAIDGQDRIYVADMTGRIQVFDRDGRLLRWWRTPANEQGNPCGLGVDAAGRLAVADTHYFRVLFYTPDGRLLEDRTLGEGPGDGPGQFQFVTDVAQDSRGCYYVAEYGPCDRIQKFSPDGRFLLQWGGQGAAPGQFLRPQSLAIDGQDRVWVADACNHRIQVFEVTDQSARLVRIWGQQGEQPGRLRYPYGLALDGRGHVYVSEFGNHRVQKFTLDGRSLACWGGPGRAPGRLTQPWGLALDSHGALFVLDTYNHRIQRVRL